MKLLARLRALPPERRPLLASALGATALVRLTSALLSFQRSRRLLRRFARSRAARTEDLDALVWAVEAAGRRIPGANCLVQASTLELLMRRRGLEPELKIGVRKEDGRLAAHAWVEYEGQEYLEGSLDGHFASLPAGRW